jgi:hypothetical protein
MLAHGRGDSYKRHLAAACRFRGTATTCLVRMTANSPGGTRAKHATIAVEPMKTIRPASIFAYRDDADRVADFHGWRHTFNNNQAQAGMHRKLAQALTRHSDVDQTLSRYTGTTRDEERAAVPARARLLFGFASSRFARSQLSATPGAGSAGRDAISVQGS